MFGWKKYLVTGALMMCSLFIFSQDYHSSAGVRFTWGSGLSYKYVLVPGRTLEGIASVRWGGVIFTGLYEKHKPAWNTPGLTWFYGFGPHIGYHSRTNVPWPTRDERSHPYISVGADAIIGLDYQFQELPILVSLDFKPMISFTGQRFLILEGIGITVRYIID